MATKAAVFSTDAALREQLARVMGEADGVVVSMETDVPYTDLEARHLDQLELLNPEVVVLDLDGNPAIALKFAQFLVESNASRKIIGVGPGLSNELLMSAMQAGVSEYLPKPATDEVILASLGRITRKLGKRNSRESKEPGQMFTVFSPKGGSGSTTIAANLAVELHRLTRKKTLLVDLDFELGETALMLGIEPEFSMVDLVRNFHRVDSDLLASYIDRHESGVEVLAAPYEPGDIQHVDGEQVRQIFDFLCQSYDYVVVDVPKSFGPATQAAFERADELFVVATPDLPSLRNLTRCLPLLRSLRRHVSEDPFRLIVNRHDGKDFISLQEIERTLELPVHASIGNDYRSVINSINAGKPGVDDGRSSFARDVRALAGKVGEVEVSPRSSGLAALFPFGGKRTSRTRRSQRNAEALNNG